MCDDSLEVFDKVDWLDRISAQKGTVGIEMMAEGLAIAAKGCFPDSSHIDLTHVISSEDKNIDLAHELSHFVSKSKIGKRLCHLILNPKDYQLLLVEAPDVADADMREAVRWRIKDLISIPVEKAVVDVFMLPDDASRSSKKMIYVVVAELDRINELIAMVNDSGLTLASIDIAEMAIRNISLIMDERMRERGIGIVRINQGGGVVSLYRAGNLYLSRQFQLAYNGGLLDDLPSDGLALEIQRSIDYYERQMGLAPPGALYIGGENISEDKITQELIRSLTVPTHYLDVTNAIKFNDEIDDGMAQICLGALGGVHREIVEL